MTKSPMIPAKTGPFNLELHIPLSTRKNPPRDLRDPVNSGNLDEGRIVRLTSGIKVGSKSRFQRILM